MGAFDWITLSLTLAAIVGYGLWRARGTTSAHDYIRGGQRDRWLAVGLGVMATQASAITFLSTPGQAYQDGMRFAQFYFGQPIAMLIVAALFVPAFRRLNVFTAYEFLESRFDRKTRQLTAALFILQRALATGLTIYAPSIILSSLLGWSLQLTNLVMGGLVIVYTVSGGQRAVSATQQQQLGVMLIGFVVALVAAVRALPEDVSFGAAVHAASVFGRTRVLDFSFDITNRYTVWSGLIGGLFLGLSYFGADQSQVGRTIAAKSIGEARLGLYFNAVLKVPMQLFILFVGVMVFAFFQFTRPPVFFNAPELARAHAARPVEMARVEAAWTEAFEAGRAATTSLVRADQSGDAGALAAATRAALEAHKRSGDVRAEAKRQIAAAVPGVETNDTDYVFLSFILGHVPHGLLGLLLAVVFCAAMSAVAAQLTALSSTAVVDFWKPSVRVGATEAQTVVAARLFTVAFGLLAIGFATFASLIDNLIQAVNILGSLFYGTILGVFVVGLTMPRVRATSVFLAAIVAEAVVLAVHLGGGLVYLWYNPIGCGGVILCALAFDALLPRRAQIN